jgi:hypothetical protein
VGWHPASLLPDTATLRGSRVRIAYPGEEGRGEGPEDIAKTLGIDFFWDWDVGDMTVSLTQTRSDSRQLWMESADTIYRTIAFDQNFYLDNWDFSLFLSADRTAYEEEENRFRDVSFNGYLSSSYNPALLPKVAVELGVDRFDSQYIDYGESFRYDSWNVGIIADFTKYLPVVDENRQPSLKFGYRTEGSRDRDTYLGSETIIGHGAHIRGNIPF